VARLDRVQNDPVQNDPLHSVLEDGHSKQEDDHTAQRDTTEVYANRAARAAAPTSPEVAAIRQAFASDRLLGWTLLAEATDGDLRPDWDALQRSTNDNDARLIQRVRAATGGRVHPEVLTAPGLFAIRYLAASLVSETCEPEQAVEALLDAISRRVGARPGVRLNSLALIGKRLAGESRRSGGHQFYAGDGEQDSQVDEDLAEIKRSDLAAVFHPQLFKRSRGVAERSSRMPPRNRSRPAPRAIEASRPAHEPHYPSLSRGQGKMRKRTIKLWRLHEDGRKLFAGTIQAGDPRELVLKWSLFLATAERGVYFAAYRGSFVGPQPALENDGGTLAA